MPGTSDPALSVIRRALLWLLVFGLVGTASELLLMEHTEDFWQLLPLMLIGAALLLMVAFAFTRAAALLQGLRAVMLLSLASGIAGSLLHYRGNVEFEKEMMPGLTGLALFRGAMSGATPALAPGTMILLGVVGLLYTYRHPSLEGKNPVAKE